MSWEINFALFAGIIAAGNLKEKYTSAILLQRRWLNWLLHGVCVYTAARAYVKGIKL
jgi:hypothetical protein